MTLIGHISSFPIFNIYQEIFCRTFYSNLYYTPADGYVILGSSVVQVKLKITSRKCRTIFDIFKFVCNGTRPKCISVLVFMCCKNAQLTVIFQIPVSALIGQLLILFLFRRLQMHFMHFQVH